MPLREIDPFRRAGTDAYAFLDEVAPESFARLAAWNAFALQTYADNLVAAASQWRYVSADIAIFARRVYQLVNAWLEEARKADASNAYRFRFDLPYPLPQCRSFHSNELLRGMRTTLETLRTRVNYELERFEGEERRREYLRWRRAQFESELEYAEGLWTRRPSDEVRSAIASTLQAGLDHAYEVGQLLALPSLFLQI